MRRSLRSFAVLSFALLLYLSSSIGATPSTPKVAIVNPDYYRILKHGLRNHTDNTYYSAANGSVADHGSFTSASSWTGLGASPDYLTTVLTDAGYQIDVYTGTNFPSITKNDYQLVIVQDPMTEVARPFNPIVEYSEPDLLQYVTNSTFLSRLDSYFKGGGSVILVGDAVRLLENGANRLNYGKRIVTQNAPNSVGKPDSRIPSHWLFIRGHPFCGVDRSGGGTYTAQQSSLVPNGAVLSSVSVFDGNDLPAVKVWSDTVYYPADSVSLLDARVQGSGQYVLDGSICNPPVYQDSVDYDYPSFMGYTEVSGRKLFYIGSDSFFDFQYRNYDGAWHAASYQEIKNQVSADGVNAILGLVRAATGEVPLGTSVAIRDPNPDLLDSNGQVTTDASRLASAPSVRKGAVADGVTQLLLRMESSGPVTFSIVGGSAADGKLKAVGSASSGAASVTVSPVTAGGSSYAFALYTSPVDFSAVPTTNATRTIQLQVSGAFDTLTQSLILERPPVVLIHGIWSDKGMWTESGFQSFLTNAGFTPELADYGTYRGYGFNPSVPYPQNKPVKFLVDATDSAKRAARSRQIAATQVDVVGHSMGGVVTRARAVVANGDYLRPDNFMKGDFHKLITIGTPHLGSELADFLWLNRWLPVTIPGIGSEPVPLALVMQFFGKPLLDGAVSDLRVGSDALLSLHTTAIPSHAVVGDAYDSSCTELEWNAILLTVPFVPATVDFLLGEGNDTIVSTNSQRGMIEATAWSYFGGVVHTAARGCVLDTSEVSSADIRANVLTALRESTGVSDFGTFKVPSTTTLLARNSFRANTRSAETVISSPSAILASTNSSEGITLTSPADGSVFQPGSTVSLMATQAVAGTFTQVLFMVESYGIIPVDGPPFQTTLTIPQDWVGLRNIIVLARDQQGALFADQVSINIQPSVALDSLVVSPQEFDLTYFSQQKQISVDGDYSDGIERDITASAAGTAYATLSGTNTVVDISPDGMVTARGNGDETVIIANGGLTNAVLAHVAILNYPPSLDPIADQTLLTGATLVIPIHATDPDTNLVTFTTSPTHEFVTLTDNGNGTGSLHLSPKLTDAGTYTVTVSGVDNGTPSLGAARDFTITVNSISNSLNITSLQLKLNFAKANADSCSVKATLDLGAGFNPSGKSVTLDVGDATVSFTLDSAGRGLNTQGTCRLSYSKSKGVWTLTGKLRGTSWTTEWANYGLVNTTVSKPGTSVSLPFALFIGDQAFASSKPLHYTAKQGKSGAAK